MSWDENLLPQAYGSGAIAKSIHMPSMKQRLAAAVQQAEERLAAVREAQEIFNKNPDLEKLLDLMQKGHF